MTDTTRESGVPAPSRRALLGAAWSAPVIVAAGTAPAYAASAAATLVLDTFTSYGAAYTKAGLPSRIETKVQVRRPWDATAPAVTSITVTVPFPDTVASGGKAASVSGAGWAAGPVTTPTKGAYTYSFTWTGKLDNTTQSTSELLFQVRRNNVATTGATLTATATSPQATSASRTIQTTI
ncbi:hypothetical protein ASC64_10365 [Nocardioides sp. Root122]|uniref:hypothetical protein n=1 Tax=Nocardioides TaxID=1839 RepID=UPI000702BCCC|nr:MULTISPECIES: hypothetical protein [Nocardioides]KQV67630.1 hypothetical protein ASC64_10365 [Nocardioides sp. Root122]MCK9824155.1 hypothetical protein [Nocardioides cavernae]